MSNLFTSIGRLKYHCENDSYKLIVEADQGIVDFYRKMIPRSLSCQPQKYPAHISVVRKEVPKILSNWGKYEGELIEFHYENIVRFGSIYSWLNCFCSKLEEIRLELGLPVSSEYTLPPDGFVKCFHMTIGNFKK